VARNTKRRTARTQYERTHGGLPRWTVSVDTPVRDAMPDSEVAWCGEKVNACVTYLWCGFPDTALMVRDTDPSARPRLRLSAARSVRPGPCVCLGPSAGLWSYELAVLQRCSARLLDSDESPLRHPQATQAVGAAKRGHPTSRLFVVERVFTRPGMMRHEHALARQPAFRRGTNRPECVLQLTLSWGRAARGVRGPSGRLGMCRARQPWPNCVVARLKAVEEIAARARKIVPRDHPLQFRPVLA
jgi:hypothetical protein